PAHLPDLLAHCCLATAGFDGPRSVTVIIGMIRECNTNEVPVKVENGDPFLVSKQGYADFNVLTQCRVGQRIMIIRLTLVFDPTLMNFPPFCLAENAFKDAVCKSC